MYLLKLLLSALVSELHVDQFPLQAAHEFYLWTLSIFGLLKLPKQPAQLKQETLVCTITQTAAVQNV